jgi:hypothetical protein
MKNIPKQLPQTVGRQIGAVLGGWQLPRTSLNWLHGHASFYLEAGDIP